MNQKSWVQKTICEPESSGYKARSHGIDGSINGRGVLVSKKSGRFIATLAPLRHLMFVVRVLWWEIQKPMTKGESSYDEREAGVGICDFLG